MIAIIDYDAGNIKSVANILQSFNADFILTDDGDKILNSDGIILPGVGSFGFAMRSLKGKGLDKVINLAYQKRIPLLGICLGQQLMLEYSEESDGEKGLGIIEGGVKRLVCKGKKLPHIGWTSICNIKGKLFEGIDKNEFFYFVHSYAVDCADRSIVSARAQYGQAFDAAVQKDNMFLVQFHPEKSGQAGRKVIQNFLKIVEDCKK